MSLLKSGQPGEEAAPVAQAGSKSLRRMFSLGEWTRESAEPARRHDRRDAQVGGDGGHAGRCRRSSGPPLRACFAHRARRPRASTSGLSTGVLGRGRAAICTISMSVKPRASR